MTTAEESLASRRRVRAVNLFLLVCVLALVLVAVPLAGLYQSETRREHYSHILLVPFVSAVLLYGRRRDLFSRPEGSTGTGIAVMVAGGLLYGLGIVVRSRLGANDTASLMVLGAILVVAGAFVATCGLSAARSALFPLAFLGFMIPLPGAVTHSVIALLQQGSAAAAHGFFSMAGVPFVRDGSVFSLPMMSIEVAPQCSGIRSAIALLITGVFAGHVFLRRGWSKTVLVLSVLPITVLKNGFRIAVLTLLGGYVDERILSSQLHQNGGIVFFGLALLLLGAVLWLLRRSEKAGGVMIDEGKRDD